MTQDDITLAIRMIARGQINHETVQALSAELARVLADAAMREVTEALPEIADQAPKKPDSIALSRPKKR